MLPFEKIKRDVLVRKDSETSDKYGSRPTERSTDEILDYCVVNLDKPRGPTSHQVSDYAKKILGATKAGHSGTLDPKVTGVLPIAFGRATRVVQSLLTAGKEYVALMHLHDDLPEDRVRQICGKFVGKIRQLPPIKSNVKRQYRFRKVYYLDIIEIDGRDVLFRVGTQAGTYIRKLIHDIGENLGCGAHMHELRRTKAGPFDESNLVTLQDLADAYHFHKEGNDNYLRRILLPIEEAVDHLAKVWVMDTTVDTICHGASLKVPGISKVHTDIQVGEPVAVMTLKDELISIGTARMTSKEMQKSEKGIAVSGSKVFMQPGLYPKLDTGGVK